MHDSSFRSNRCSCRRHWRQTFRVTAAGDGGSYTLIDTALERGASTDCPNGNRFSGFASAVQTAKAVLRLIGSPGTSLKRVFMSLLDEG